MFPDADIRSRRHVSFLDGEVGLNGVGGRDVFMKRPLNGFPVWCVAHLM